MQTINDTDKDAAHFATLVAHWDLGMTLGECATWDARTQRFLWTDIELSVLYVLNWGATVPTRHALPHRLASFGLTKDPDVLLAAFDYGLAWLDLRDLSVVDITTIEGDRKETRLNDGRMDRQGRFWVGSMANVVGSDTIGAGRLYCFDGHGEPTVHRDGIVIPNSLAWSPDGRTLYFTDSRTFRVDAYDFDIDAGVIANRRLFATLAAGIHSDGSCVDVDGCLWNAQWGAGQVVCYSPEGVVRGRINLSTLEPTCVGFGGPDLDHLLVVTANLGASADGRTSTGNGSAFLFKTSTTGIEDPVFAIAPPA